MHDIPDDLITADEAAELLGFHKAYLANLRMKTTRIKNTPPFYRSGEGRSCTIRYSKSELLKWEKERVPYRKSTKNCAFVRVDSSDT